MSAVLLAVLCLPYIFKQDDSIALSEHVSVSRQKYDLYSKLDGMPEYDLYQDMLMLLTEEAANSTNPLLRTIPFFNFNKKLKLNGFGLQVIDEDVTNAIMKNDKFNINEHFDAEEYEKFLQTHSLTDEMYREYVRESLSAKVIADIINHLSKYAINGMGKYIDHLVKTCKQNRTVLVREISAENIPTLEITESDILKTYLENQHKFKTKRTAKIELVHYQNAKEIRMKLQDGQGRRGLDNMTMSDISRLVGSKVINITLTEDELHTADVLAKEVTTFIKKHAHYGEKYKGLMSYEHNGVIYFFKFTEYKKSEVDQLDNIREDVIKLTQENKMKEYCNKHIDELIYNNEKKMMFNLIDIVPYAVIPAGTKEIDTKLDIGRTAFQLDNDKSNSKIIYTNGKLYRVFLESIDYNELRANDELQYREFFKHQIIQDILLAYINRIMTEKWPAKAQ